MHYSVIVGTAVVHIAIPCGGDGLEIIATAPDSNRNAIEDLVMYANASADATEAAKAAKSTERL